MVITLKTNFRDFYDHQFAGSWQQSDIIFPRYTTDGMDRKSMFDYMRGRKLNPPIYGTVKEIYHIMFDSWSGSSKTFWANSITKIVVYTNMFDHCGEGKILLSAAEALEKYPNHFGSLFVASLMEGTYSYRFLQIGKRQFCLKYSSDDEWRSNCGNVDVEVIQEYKTYETFYDRFDYPLFAIDYIEGAYTFHVDFNIAPGLKNTGIEDCISAKDIYQEIDNWYLTKALKMV